MTKKSFVAQVLVASVGLVVARLLFDIASATESVYPEYQFGQKLIAFGILGISLLAVIILAIIRFGQRQLLRGLLLLILIAIPYFFPRLIDSAYWRFRANKTEYLAIINVDPQSSPKYRVFSWGNRNTGLGGWIILEAIVYDESDQITQGPESQSEDWKQRLSKQPPEDRWIAAVVPAYPPCSRRIKPLDSHFYYVVMVC